MDGDFEDPFDEIQDQLNGTKAWGEPCSDCNDIEQQIGDGHEFEDTDEFEDTVQFQDDAVEFHNDHYQDCSEEFEWESVQVQRDVNIDLGEN